MTRLAVIGCGNMGRAIVHGILDAKWAKPADVVATVPEAAKARRLSKELGIKVITQNRNAAKGADVVLLGVKPQIMPEVLAELRGTVSPKQLVISIAAGVSCARMEEALGAVPVVRSMPNLAATIQMSATAMCAGKHAGREHLKLAHGVLEAIGTVEEVHENLMDAVTGLSGTGPMYVFHLIEAMSDAGVKVGLARNVATRLAMQTVAGGARLAWEADTHPAALKDQVTSPGGTAIAALHVLRKQAWQAIVMDAVEAATKRSKELGQ